MADISKPLYKNLLLALLTSFIVAFGTLAIQFLTASRPFIGGIDFYYYILNARDAADGMAGAPHIRYTYFPGVYSFWTNVFLVTDGSLEALQWAYFGVMLADGILVGCILATLTRIWQAGVFATALYIFAAGRIEGMYGVTEPISTIPFLTGLWMWVLLRGTGNRRAATVVLAAGFGLALFSKQQGALLLLGVFGLLQDSAYPALPFRKRVADVLAVTGGALLIFLAALFLEGGGVEALTMGLRYAVEYQPEGSWLLNLSRAYTSTQPVSNLFLSACVIWLALTIAPRRLPELPPLMLPVLGLTVLSALGCMLQFSRRGYLHYALLSLPSAIIAGGVVLFVLATILNRQAHRRFAYAGTATIIGTAAFLLVNSAGTMDFVRFVSSQLTSVTRWSPHDTLRQTFAPLCAHIEPGSGLLLIPQRQDIVHWQCRTHAVSPVVGYRWGPTDVAYYMTAASSPKAAGVFVFAKQSGDYERLYFMETDRTRIIQNLEQLGYRETFSFDMGQLYQRSGRQIGRPVGGAVPFTTDGAHRSESTTRTETPPWG